MEKRILAVSYWLGLLSALIAMGLWALNLLGRLARNVVLVQRSGWFESFYKGALLFLVIAIATGMYISSRGERTS